MTEEERRLRAAPPRRSPGEDVILRRKEAGQDAEGYIKSSLGKADAEAAGETLIDLGAESSGRGKPIGREEVLKATKTLKKYKAGKANLEKKVIENEKWFKLRHWECMRGADDDIQPTSGWLFNVIANKLADALDNFPTENILPREEGDKAEAQRLSSIIPVILDENDFEKTYTDVWEYKLKSGTGVYAVTWNSQKLNGLGDIDISKVDLLNCFWEPGISDIQKSQNFFVVDLIDNEVLAEAYPGLIDSKRRKTIDVAEYEYDDTVDTSEKSVVVDWYYKRSVNGRTILHFCKYVDDIVLYATENEPAYAERGIYDHGKYPFFFDPLFGVEGTPTGFGYIDLGKDAQEYIDRGNQAIMKNMLANTKPRYFTQNNGNINEEEFADLNRDIVHVEGQVDDRTIRVIEGKSLPAVYVNVIEGKINELKEVTGTRDVSTGGTTGGVTAASALSAMMEMSAKLARANIKSSYRVFREMIGVIIELIRQFYDLPRCFRIMGERGTEQFLRYKNSELQPRLQTDELGREIGYRLPVFDIEITAEKKSPYSRMAQNELALDFYNRGFFDPSRSDQALTCLDMMDFDRKDFVVQKISENGTMFQTIIQLQQQMMMMGQMIDGMRGGNETVQGLLAQFEQMGLPVGTPTGASAGGSTGSEYGESSITKNARERAAGLATPR